MTLPVITVYPDVIPDKGQSQTIFDTNVDSYLTWQTTFATQLTPWITHANTIGAALVAANLPPLTGRALDAVRVNAAADGVEFVDVTAAGWAFLAAADTAAQRTALEIPAPVSLTQAQAEDDASTVFGQVSGQRLGQAIAANVSPSVVLLGTLTTTSGSTQTLSSLDLTPYKVLRAVWNSVSHDKAADDVIIFAGQSVTGPVNRINNIYGITDIDLLNGIGISSLADLRLSTSDVSTVRNIRTSLTNASTSVSVTISGGSFDLGSIKIYGVK
jgi:hypothetical protein